MVTVVRSEHGDSSSNQDEAVCISDGANTFRKSMNPAILSPAIGK